MDYYKILNIAETSSREEIKTVYRKLALKYHPDRNPRDKKAEEMFKKIGEAYEVLGNEEKRKEYDKKKGKVNSGFRKFKTEKKRQKSYTANFSANPSNIEEMFKRNFDFNNKEELEKEEMKKQKNAIKKSFEQFFKIKERK